MQDQAPSWSALSECLPSLVEELPVGVLQLSASGGIDSSNALARQLLDGRQGRLLADSLKHVAQALNEEDGPVELVVSQGSRGHVKLLAVAAPSRTHHVALLMDDHEERLRQMTLAMRRLVGLGVQKLSFDDATRSALTIVGTLVPASSIRLYRRSADCGGLALLCSVQRQLPGAPPPAPPPTLSGRVFGDLVPSSGGSGEADAAQLSGLALPIAVAGVLRGVLWTTAAPESFLENELRLLQTLADVLAILFEREADRNDLARHSRRRSAVDPLRKDAVLEQLDDERVVAAEGNAHAVFGRTAEELNGARLEELLAADQSQKLKDALARLKYSPRTTERLTVRHHDGRDVTCRVTLLVEPTDSGSRLVRAVFEDASHDDEVAGRLSRSSHADRLASLGQLAAGLVHELGNVLTFVIGDLDLVEQGWPDEAAHSPVRDLVAETRAGAERMLDLIKDVKFLARGSTSARTARIDEVLHSTLRLVAPQLRGVATVASRIPSLPEVQGDPHQLAQVFLNLVLNAVQAMPGRQAGDNHIQVNAALSGEFVEVEVVDNGAGIPAAALPRIFDPFFSTKPEHLGTGLGLSIVKEILDKLGAAISVDTSAGVGTTFRVRLSQACESRDTPGRSETGRGKLRVLVVDDDQLVARSVARLLSRFHGVTITGSVLDALALIAKDGGYDVILSDINMPIIDGLGFHGRLAALSPGLETRLIFMTGGMRSFRRDDPLEALGNEVVSKPLSMDALLDVIDRVAGRPPHGE